MPGPPTQPILVRDDTVVATAVGVSDPSLTLVEFTDGVGFLLAESFQSDNATRLDALEGVSVCRYAGRAWTALECERIVLSWDSDHREASEQMIGELGVAPARWTPAVFFLTAEEFFTHRASLKARQPEQVLRAVFARAAAMPALQAGALRLWTRHREALERLFVPSPKGRVQPKKETVRISLPPKPATRQTVRISLPPRSIGKETIRLELPPSVGVVPLAPTPGEAKPAASKLAALKKWLTEKFRKVRPPRRAAALDEVKSQLSNLTPEERAELERWLRKFLPPEEPPPKS